MNYCGAPDAVGSQLHAFVRPGAVPKSLDPPASLPRLLLLWGTIMRPLLQERASNTQESPH